jgi:hypothetical protein
MAETKTTKLWDEYIRWSLTPAHERGTVSSKAEWARAKGVTDRTLRRWEQDERFKERMSELGATVAEARVAKAAKVVDDAEVEVTADEHDYRTVKTQLIESAKTGNQKSMDLYFRTYGKQFVEEEAASRVSDFASMDLDVLVSEAVLALGEVVVADALRAKGWTVERA